MAVQNACRRGRLCRLPRHHGPPARAGGFSEHKTGERNMVGERDAISAPSEQDGLNSVSRVVDTGIRQGWTSVLFLALHSAARWFCTRRLRPLGRFVQVASRFLFGSDVDALADISPRAVIPHTVGIVIGATAVVEEGAIIMPNVVLGAKESAAGGRRHPHICKGALIGAGAVILGPVVIGEYARVGANSVVLQDVPPRATVVGIPAKQVQPE